MDISLLRKVSWVSTIVVGLSQRKMAAPSVPPEPAATSATSASNALFLITFGMFLAAAVIPALLAALIRSAILLAALFVVCVTMNPTDHSFACWVSEQEDIDLRLKKEKPGVKQWLTAVVKTAIAMVTQEPLTWTYYNVMAFSVVYVPSLNRYAFGCLGNWWWADKVPRLLPICKAQWVVQLSRGGEASGIERYMEEDTPEARRRMSGNRSTRRPLSPRPRPSTTPPSSTQDFESAATAFAASLGDLAESLQSTWSGGSSGSTASDREPRSSSSTATGSSDRALRASAMKAKINKDWKQATRLFLEASRVALSILSRTNYQLEAAWCEVEDATDFPNQTSHVSKMIEDICEELSSAGYFDDAARALSEFAQRLKRKFPQHVAREATAKQLGDLYLRAQRLAETGNSTRGALENAKRAASTFAEAALWQLAEECFEEVGKLQVKEKQVALANDSFGDAVLCRIALGDITGADQRAQVYRRIQLTGLGRNDDTSVDRFLDSVFIAYEKWSVSLLETAIREYETYRRLQPWQLKCLANLHEKMATSDIR